jgi:hypothetical protein
MLFGNLQILAETNYIAYSLSNCLSIFLFHLFYFSIQSIDSFLHIFQFFPYGGVLRLRNRQNQIFFLIFIAVLLNKAGGLLLYFGDLRQKLGLSLFPVPKAG